MTRCLVLGAVLMVVTITACNGFPTTEDSPTPRRDSGRIEKLSDLESEVTYFFNGAADIAALHQESCSAQSVNLMEYANTQEERIRNLREDVEQLRKAGVVVDQKTVRDFFASDERTVKAAVQKYVDSIGSKCRRNRSYLLTVLSEPFMQSEEREAMLGKLKNLNLKGQEIDKKILEEFKKATPITPSAKFWWAEKPPSTSK